MILSTVRRILKEDLNKGGDKIPSWVDQLISPLNQFLEQVTSALRNRLTFADNFQCVVKSVKIESGTPEEISTGSNLKVSGVVILDPGGLAVDKFGFDRLSNGNLSLSVDFDGGTGKSTVTFLILLG